MTKAGVGTSYTREAKKAGQEAAQQALAELDGTPDVALVFATAEYDQKLLLDSIREEMKIDNIVGCSGEGTITQGVSREVQKAVAVMAISSSTMTFEPFLQREYAQAPERVADALAEKVKREEDAIGMWVVPDGLVGNCGAFLQHLGSRLVDFPIVGGTSADAMRFEQTYQYCGDDVVSGAVAGVIIRGEGRMRYSVSHGCAPLGLERTVTRAENGWVYEIDSHPAWEVFKEYLDGEPQDLNAEGVVHLCIGLPIEGCKEYSDFIIRTPLQLDKENGALFFPGGDLSDGQRIRFTRRDQILIRESASKCARELAEAEEPKLVLQFDCAGRGKILFGSCAAEHIVQPLQDELGGEVPWLGFHTYGEIAPIGGKPNYHNYSVALCALYDT